MTQAGEAVSPDRKIRDRIIVALDVDSEAEAGSIVRELGDAVGAFKIGLQLFTSVGPGVVRKICDQGNRVFLDLKFHDIPNTVAKASVEAVRLGVWMFNVHASGGSEMMERTASEVANACERESMARPLLIGVTLLTSSDPQTLREIGLNGTVDQHVIRLARLTANAGLDGVVASPLEVPAIRAEVTKPNFLTVTPGIRSNRGTEDDQKRVTTIRDAVAKGSDFVVIGRPITGSIDRLDAVESLVNDSLAVGE
ncbi:MAG: orotidine-5'-phosphate decarboxylase [Pyrinomonadaceae bacterium]